MAVGDDHAAFFRNRQAQREVKRRVQRLPVGKAARDIQILERFRFAAAGCRCDGALLQIDITDTLIARVADVQVALAIQSQPARLVKLGLSQSSVGEISRRRRLPWRNLDRPSGCRI